jgi:probable O-glycosylation ligase (exosortase A-associated)
VERAAWRHSDNPTAFWGLMTFTAILFLAPQTLIPALAPFRIALLAAAVAIGAQLIQRFVHQEPLMRVTTDTWLAFALLGWSALTIPMSYWPGGSVSFLLDLYLKSLLVFWLLANVIGHVTRLRQAAWGLSLMAAVIAVCGIGNYLSGKFIAGGAANRIMGYEAALTQNPNDLALLLNLVLPFTVALLLITRSPIARMILLACMTLDVVTIVVTFSRAGFVTLATIFLTYVWRLRRRPQRAWAIGALVAAVMALPLLPAGYSERLSTITDVDSDPTGSAQGRLAGMIAASAFVLRHPVTGGGLGMSVLALNDTLGKPAWSEVHNVYLQYAVDLGIPGLALFLLLLVRAIVHARAVSRRAARHAPALACLAEGIAISLIAFAVAAFFHPAAYHFYFYYIAGLALAAVTAYESGVTSEGLGADASRVRAPRPSLSLAVRSSIDR